MFLIFCAFVCVYCLFVCLKGRCVVAAELHRLFFCVINLFFLVCLFVCLLKGRRVVPPHRGLRAQPALTQVAAVQQVPPKAQTKTKTMRRFKLPLIMIIMSTISTPPATGPRISSKLMFTLTGLDFVPERQSGFVHPWCWCNPDQLGTQVAQSSLACPS